MKFAAFSSGGLQLLHPASLPMDESSSLTFTSIAKLPHFDHPPLVECYRYSISLQKTLQGKLLLLDELPYSIKLIHDHYLHGYVGYMKSIIKRKERYECRRCGNRKQQLFARILCARCQDHCTYCRKCLMMGRASECNPLVYWRGTEQAVSRSNHQTVLSWNGKLSPEQAEASRVVVEAIVERRRQLIWAVCGSGKTEILFEGLRYAFEQQLRVCIATPRVDVVLELEPRLKSVFPTISIAALYGGAPLCTNDSQLMISTTHQLLRYRKAFDVVIVDEVDAFPYSYDPMLAFAVERAKKERAAMILLTATPNEQLKKEVNDGTLAVVKIPIRYHRHPLPVPRFSWCGNWEKRLRKRKIPSVVFDWLQQRMTEKRRSLLFVPSVSVAKQVQNILSAHFHIEAVFAEDEKRKEKVAKFRRGEIQFLVTTTILERGVTIPNIDVAVLGAENDIFTESALVQIAGRVGRSADYPTGEVCFFHYGKTKAMVQAVRHILEMNQYVR